MCWGCWAGEVGGTVGSRWAAAGVGLHARGCGQGASGKPHSSGALPEGAGAMRVTASPQSRGARGGVG